MNGPLLAWVDAMKPKKLEPCKQKLIPLPPTGMLIEDNILLLKQCFVSNINYFLYQITCDHSTASRALVVWVWSMCHGVISFGCVLPPGVLCSVLGSRLKVSMAWETNCPKLDRFGLRVGVPHVRHRVSRWGWMPCWRNMTIPGDSKWPVNSP